MNIEKKNIDIGIIISALFAGKTPELQSNHSANLNCSQWFVPAIILHKLNITNEQKCIN